jgi:hypothetical protein
MPLIEFGSGASGPLASLEVGTKYTTTSFPEDLSESPYFILFRAKKEYRLSNLQETSLGGTSEIDYFDPNSATGMVKRKISNDNSFLSKVGRGIKKAGKFFETLEGPDGGGIRVSLPSHSFALPIPSNLATTYKADYESSGIGPLGVEARNIAQGVQNDPSTSLYASIKQAMENEGTLDKENITGILANLGVAVTKETDVAAVLGGIIGGAPGVALGAAAGNIGKGALLGLGIARNPHIANIFTGVQFKEHNFSYKLVAKSKKESDTIRDMIRNFKYHMSPEYRAEDHLFNYPSQFEIQLRAGDYLFEFGDSILTNFTVNYNGEGAPYFFEETNAPYSVNIAMSFRETSIVTKKEIRQGR